MEKSLSIIQGLTATDQVNPIRITDAGELKVASSSTINPAQIAVDGDPYRDINTTDDIKYVNTIAGPLDQSNTGLGAQVYQVGTRNGTYDVTGTRFIGANENKLLVEQGKQFRLVYVNTINIPENYNESDITGAIIGVLNDYITNHGPRYDDFKITTITTADPTNKFTYVNIVITRYYDQ